MKSDLLKDIEDQNIILSSIHTYFKIDTSELENECINCVLKEISFESSKATEYFISYETTETIDNKPILYGFLRLFLSRNSGKTTKKSTILPQML